MEREYEHRTQRATHRAAGGITAMGNMGEMQARQYYELAHELQHTAENVTDIPSFSTAGRSSRCHHSHPDHRRAAAAGSLPGSHLVDSLIDISTFVRIKLKMILTTVATRVAAAVASTVAATRSTSAVA